MLRSTHSRLTVLALLVVAASPAPAGDPVDPPAVELWDRAYVQFGGFFMTVDSKVRLGNDNLGVGIDVSVEKFLGLAESNTAFRFDGGWRVGDNLRHRFGGSWFALNRSGRQTISEDLQLPDGRVISVGTGIESTFDFDIFRLSYDYSYLLDERIDMFVGGGLYVMPIEVGFGETGSDQTQQAITAPLPVLSLGFNVVLNRNWFLRTDVDFLYLSISGFEGAIRDLSFGVDRNITRHLAIGVGVEALTIQIDAEEGSNYPGVGFVGTVGFEYVGLQLYFKGSF